MKDSRSIAVIACVMLVTLRLMIGWQFVYEGLWKVKTLKSPTPWTAAGYLKNSQGPFRGFFRTLAGDPDELSWITRAEEPDERGTYPIPAVEARWGQWHQKFVKHYGLSERQTKTLDRWVNGSNSFEVELTKLPDEVNFDELGLSSVIRFDAAKKRLIVDGVRHLIPAHRAKIEKVLDADIDGVPDSIDFDITGQTEVGEETDAVDADKDGIDDVADVDATGGEDENKNGIDDVHVADEEAVFLAALAAVFKKSKDGLSFKEKLRATVAGNPDWVDDEKTDQVGEISKYEAMLEEYEENLAAAAQDFNWDHLQYSWGKIQAKRAQLVGPVKGLEKEMKDKATDLLSVEQLRRGPVGEPWTRLRISDLMTILGLTILGAMLILGLGTRFAAIMAAVMVFMFYAAMPPWPGLPEVPGPEHSYVVNKNFIEVIALLAIAALPTGQWFGVDGLLIRWFGRRKPVE